MFHGEPFDVAKRCRIGAPAHRDKAVARRARRTLRRNEVRQDTPCASQLTIAREPAARCSQGHSRRPRRFGLSAAVPRRPAPRPVPAPATAATPRLRRSAPAPPRACPRLRVDQRIAAREHLLRIEREEPRRQLLLAMAPARAGQARALLQSALEPAQRLVPRQGRLAHRLRQPARQQRQPEPGAGDPFRRPREPRLGPIEPLLQRLHRCSAARDRRSASAESCSSSLTCGGATSSAPMLGVGARRSAARSASVTSVSWPTPLTTGSAEATIARTTRSSLKAHRSSSEPPPRQTIRTSTSARRFAVASAAHQRGRRLDALHADSDRSPPAGAARAAPERSAHRAAPPRRAR